MFCNYLIKVPITSLQAICTSEGSLHGASNEAGNYSLLALSLARICLLVIGLVTW